MSFRKTIECWRIYAITDRAMAGGRTHADIGAELIHGGARVIQVRDKTTPYEELVEDTRELVSLARHHGVSIIANDNPYLARDADADGVHIGQTDCPIWVAREVVGEDRIVGLSTHSREQALKAQLLDVDYIGFGPIFATASKASEYKPLGLDAVRWAARTLRTPFAVIGGITRETLPDVLAAGARHCAMISDLMRSDDVAEAMRDCIRLYEQILGDGSQDSDGSS